MDFITLCHGQLCCWQAQPLFFLVTCGTSTTLCERIHVAKSNQITKPSVFETHRDVLLNDAKKIATYQSATAFQIAKLYAPAMLHMASQNRNH